MHGSGVPTNPLELFPSQCKRLPALHGTAANWRTLRRGDQPRHRAPVGCLNAMETSHAQECPDVLPSYRYSLLLYWERGRGLSLPYTHPDA